MMRQRLAATVDRRRVRRPRPGALRGDAGTSGETPLPRRLKHSSLRMRMGEDQQAVHAEADQRGARQSGEDRGGHGGPPAAIGRPVGGRSAAR